MKKIFTLSVPILIGMLSVTLFISSCVKNQLPRNDDNYWLSQEQGEVVYSDTYCSYYVIETYNGFTIVRGYGSYKPYEGTIVYGNFSSRGTRDIYNQSTGTVFNGTVTDYWLSYIEAQDALDYYCPYSGKGAEVTREFKKSSIKK